MPEDVQLYSQQYAVSWRMHLILYALNARGIYVNIFLAECT